MIKDTFFLFLDYFYNISFIKRYHEYKFLIFVQVWYSCYYGLWKTFVDHYVIEFIDHRLMEYFLINEESN